MVVQHELVFDDKVWSARMSKLDASVFKVKDQIAEMTVSAKSGVEARALLLPKVKKRVKMMLRISLRIGSGLVSHQLMAMMTISTIARKSN